MTFLLLMLLTGSSTTMLFVGNSYTMANGGLWTMVQEICQSLSADTLNVLNSTAGGTTLQDHWNDPELQEMLQFTDIDIAIFQEQSCMPVVDPEQTYMYGDSLAMLCISNGIQPAFLMTWARKNDSMMLQGLCSGYSRMGFQHQCPVAPCGIGFELNRNRFALLDPYDDDGAHPSLHGSYLAACVICSSVLQLDLQSPDAWVPEGISPITGELLRMIAVEACSLYHQPMEMKNGI